MLNASSSLRATIRDAVRTQLWPLPVLGLTVAVAAGILLPILDARLDQRLPSWPRAVLFGGDPDAARTVLQAVSSSLITVTSLTFSLTVVTLQLASSQFSPRLLRTFTRDLFVQTTLAIFLATFTYSLTVLRTVRSSGDGQLPFVPRMAVSVSFLLALVSVTALVLFLAHLARQIRVETMLREVHANASATVRAVMGDRDADESGPLPQPPESAVLILAASSGFLVAVEEHRLLAAAVRAEAIIRLDCCPGDWLVEGVPIGSAWPREAQGFGAAVVADLRAQAAAAVRTGFERTGAQDPGFGLRQLADVTNKALSPGINDPTTAIHALGHISGLLAEMAHRDPGPVSLREANGQVRVVLNRPDLGALVDMAITQPRRYGASDPQVIGRIYALLFELSWHIQPSQQQVVIDQLARLEATTDAADLDGTERAQLRALADKVRLAVSRHRGSMAPDRLPIPHD